VTRLLLGDYIRLLQIQQQQKLKNASSSNNNNTMDGDTADAASADVLYTEKDLFNCLNKVTCIDYHTVITYQSNDTTASTSTTTTSTTANPNTNYTGTVVSFYALNAGHVLGACMYYITIGGDRTVLYTGDYSMEDDRHLMAAELPVIQQTITNNSNNTTTAPTSTDVLICESTYGVQVHASRTERETRFTTTIERIVTRGGKCLIPVFALGRAQVTYIYIYSCLCVCCRKSVVSHV
jgi:cleavage and polyadenylation specificity factor subunit 3